MGNSLDNSQAYVKLLFKFYANEFNYEMPT